MKKSVLLAIIILIFFCLSQVSAATVGISPARINFANVLRGGFAEKSVSVTLDSDEPVSLIVKPRGNISEWLEFSDVEFEVSRDKPYNLVISVNPPVDVPNGNYTGILRVESSSLGSARENYATGIVRTALDLAINVEITDIETVSCRATNYNVNSVEIGDDLVFTADILNEGNIILKPSVKINIWDQDQLNILETKNFVNDGIKPTQRQKVTMKMPSDNLEIGQYWAEIISEECYSSQIVTFDILEVGALKADGNLIQILTKTWAEIGETVPITATFENKGEKDLEAVFKGKIMYGDKIVQVIESEEKVFVPKDDSTVFQFYFSPKNAGKYIISGRVFYDKKRTFEKSAVMNVKDEGFRLSSLLKPAVYLILVIVIAFLIYKIRKERSSYLGKLEGIR